MKPSETPVEEVIDDVETVGEDTLVAVNENADIVVNEKSTEQVDEAAVEEILTIIGEAAAKVQKDLYPEDVKEETKSEEKVPEQKGTDVIPDPIAFTGHYMPVIPKKGSMTFEYNNADDALATIKCLLSNAKVNLTISWECVFDGSENVQGLGDIK